MKHHILSILFGALSVILTACSSDITPEPDVPSAKGESILCLEIQKQDLTRGIITSTSFEKGDSVFVVVTDAQHPDPLTFTSAAVYNGNEWILKEKIDLSAETYGIGWTSATVEVYYPYETFFQAFNPSNQTMIIMENPLDQEDILYGKATGINSENPSAKVSCGHLKSRLSFEFRNNSDSPVGITKMSVTTEGDQLFLGRYGYISNGYFNIPDEYTKDFAMNCNIEIAAGETATLDFLIPPTEQAYEMMEEKMELDGISKTTLKFSLEAGERTVNFDIEAKPWAPGCQYTYPVNISDSYTPNPDDFEYVDLGLSVLWATCNVGAETTEDIGKFFFWGDTKGLYKGESADIGLAAFIASKDDDVLLNEGIIELAPNSAESEYKYCLSSKYDAATHYMGAPWRMPLADELKELEDNTVFDLIKINDKWTFRFTSKISGYEDKYILLPAPGGRFGTSSGTYTFIPFTSETNQPKGFLWSSSLPFDYKWRGMILEILWYYAQDYPSTWLRSLDRTNGYNIRGVKPKE